MAKIRNFALPKDLTDALAATVQEVDPDLLLSWGRECLPGGFRKLEPIRQRLVARIRSDTTLDERLMELLGTGLPLVETVNALSLAALKKLYAPLAALAGREPCLLTLLFDAREEVHKWGVEQAIKPAAAPVWDPETARGRLLDFVEEALLLPAGAALPLGGREPIGPKLLERCNESRMAELNEKLEAQRKRIEHLNHELHQQKQHHQAKLKAHSEAAERDKKGLRAEAVRVQGELLRAQKEKQALEARLTEASERIDAAVAREMERQTSELVRKWLGEPLRTEAAVHELKSRGPDLLKRAGLVLEAQAGQDRHSGNRLELQRHLAELRSAQERVEAALRSALTPIPELRPLLTDLESEIARLEKLLAGPKPVSQLTSRLLTSINAAETWEDVRGLSQFVDQLAERGWVASEEVRGIYNAIQRKFSLFEETRKTGEGDNGWALRNTLYRNKPALLLLDGHNLLFSLKDIFAPEYEDGHPARRARERLVQVVHKLVANRPNITTKICFDGPEGGCVRKAPNLEVIYSGGEGKNRADELIVSHLQFKDLQSVDQKVFVVTDDREVRRGILRAGASFVPCDLFAVFLNDFQCLV